MVLTGMSAWRIAASLIGSPSPASGAGQGRARLCRSPVKAALSTRRGLRHLPRMRAVGAALFPRLLLRLLLQGLFELLGRLARRTRLDRYRRHALFLHVELPRGAFGEIDDPTIDIGPAVIDLDVDRLAVLLIRHRRSRAERQIRRGGRELVLVEGLAIGGLFPLKLAAVVRRLTLLLDERLLVLRRRFLAARGKRCEHQGDEREKPAETHAARP